jgi:hypothetical protein
MPTDIDLVRFYSGASSLMECGTRVVQGNSLDSLEIESKGKGRFTRLDRARGGWRKSGAGYLRGQREDRE